ncbi:hypothetical protein ACLBP3_14500, partial [Klebsiella pneumoniae]
IHAILIHMYMAFWVKGSIMEQMQGHNVNSGSRLLDCELIVRGSTQKIRR